MKTYSSTALKAFDSNCPKALGFVEAGTPADTDQFNPGIAAHAVLQHIGQKGARTPEDQATVADAVVQELITVGREYNHIHEPPMAPSQAFEGRDVALAWLEWNELPQDAKFEIGLGMTAEGEPCDYYAENCRYRALIDIVKFETIGDEDYAIDVVTAGDYKSAWPTDERELDTLQRRGQAVLVHKHYPDYPAVRMEAINVRKGMTYERTVQLDDEGRALLAQWEKDILQACNAADVTREARPGAGCLDCRYTLTCDDCLHYYEGNGAQAAVTLATLEAIRKKLIEVLKPKAMESKFPVPGGFVGFKPMVKKVLTEDAHRHLCEHWYSADTDPHIQEQSLLAACNLTSGSLEKMVKVMYPDKKDAGGQDLLEACLTTVTESRFGVYKS